MEQEEEPSPRGDLHNLTDGLPGFAWGLPPEMVRGLMGLLPL